MSRTTKDEISGGRVWNGFDYNLQVWVVNGIVQRCGHPDRMRPGGKACCNQFKLAGKNIFEIPQAQRREEHKEEKFQTENAALRCAVEMLHRLVQHMANAYSGYLPHEGDLALFHSGNLGLPPDTRTRLADIEDTLRKADALSKLGARKTTIAYQDIDKILADPSVHALTKDTILAGLKTDPIDAYYDVLLAAKALEAIMDHKLDLTA